MPTLSFDVLKIQHAENAAFWTVIPAISRAKVTEPEIVFMLKIKKTKKVFSQRKKNEIKQKLS